MQNLQPFHTFGLNAQAKQVIEIQSIEQLKQVWTECQQRNEPVLFLGMGSNVLFVEDFNGTVMLNRLKGIQHQQDADFHYLHVSGGENWHSLVEWTVAQDIGGLENLALIPGCAGSAPIQNIGAYGVEFKDVCDYVDVLNLTNGEIFRLTNLECEFGYRESIFKHKLTDGYVIVAVGLKLAKDWQPVLQYGELTKLDKSAVQKSEIFNLICQIRGGKLPEPAKIGNAGSFYKNPVVNPPHFEKLQQQYPTIPHFPQANGEIKLAAGWLIDQCGLKGFQIGGAAVHQHQALVLINKENAKAEDILALAQQVRQQVGQKFNVWLRPEVRFIGANGEVDAVQAISKVGEKMNFTEILSTLPTVDHLAELQVQVQDNGNVVHQIPAIAGKLGSLRVYNALLEQFEGELNPQSAQKGLQLFAEHVADAEQNPGKHPNIDLLFKIIAENKQYQLVAVEG